MVMENFKAELDTKAKNAADKGADAGTKQAPEPARMVSLAAYIKQVSDMEVEEMKGNGIKLPAATCVTKNVIAQFTAELNVRAAIALKSTNCNIYMETVSDPRFPEGRPQPYMAGEGCTRLYYSGRIIDSVAACNVNKVSLMYLGDNKERGPVLYLDGGQVLNFRKSDVCIPWFMKPLPPLSKMKKKKLVATHRVIWEECSFAVDGIDFTYNLPLLENLPVGNLPIPATDDSAIVVATAAAADSAEGDNDADEAEEDFPIIIIIIIYIVILIIITIIIIIYIVILIIIMIIFIISELFIIVTFIIFAINIYCDHT